MEARARGTQFGPSPAQATLPVRHGRFALTLRGNRPPLSAGHEIDRLAIALLGLAVLLPGVLVVLELPTWIELAGDLAVAGFVLWLAAKVLRADARIVVPYLAIAFLILLLVAGLRGDELLRPLVSAKNFLLLPALALCLSWLAIEKEQNRLILLSFMGLVIFEFGLTIIQTLTVDDVDVIVGSFGDYSQPSTAFALVAGACLALGVFASRAGSWRWLVVAAVVPVFSVWAAVRIVPLVVPVAGLAVAVAAFWATRRPGARDRRGIRAFRGPLLVAGTALASTAVLFGLYAVARPGDFQLFVDSEAREVYLRDADIYLRDSEAQRGSEKSGGARADGSPKSKPESEPPTQVPGRGEQYRIAMTLVDGDPMSFMFGLGLGATTYAENLGIEEPASYELRVVGLSDAGTLLVELGWLGVGLTLAGGLALALGAMEAARRVERGSWTQALLISYPGVLVAMAAASFHGTPFRNLGSAVIFWLLTGLALAAIYGIRGFGPRPTKHDDGEP